MDIHCEIIPEVLSFEPVFNSKYSFVNDSIYKRTGMDAGLIFHVILFALVWLILFLQYRFFKGIAPKNKMLDVSFSFFTAAAICAYLGILIWEKGTLDFLHFKLLGDIICDLKDIYINCFVVLLVISTTKIAKEHEIKVKDMVSYVKGLFRKKAQL
jgi:signal peptidase II